MDVMPSNVMPVNYDSEPGNEVNNKAKRQRGVTVTCKRKARTLLCVGDENETVSHIEATPNNADNQGLLRHRMAPGGFLNLVERLDYEQWSTIMDTEFREILAVRTRLVPKRLARWSLEKYDLRDTSLNLPNGQLIYEEDVHVTLGLPMGPIEISEAEVDLQQYLKELDEVQDQQGISIESSTTAAAKE
ncbi:hypothetical protein Cgig2_010210 [Carnegiea gigantea]|uniref:Uncharacterized protein n=1 Tax=Carnegiea gigantea TaxID=171969 RepID=A0A9Q1GKC5_9CARY|nr:hypothetical protein Cgig2_010210 [Carnegiea gigantea]